MNSETQSLVPATQQAESVELTIEQVRENLSVTEKGQPANTIGNCRTVFCQDPLLRGAIRLNLLTDRVDIVRDLGWRRSTSALTDTDVKYATASVLMDTYAHTQDKPRLELTEKIEANFYSQDLTPAASQPRQNEKPAATKISGKEILEAIRLMDADERRELTRALFA